MDLFTFDRPRRDIVGESPVAPTRDAYSPYGEAWNEFDRLQRTASGRGPLSWTGWVFDMLLAFGFIFEIHFSKKYAFWLFAGWFVVRTIYFVDLHIKQKRFERWPCPRCHAEWPGTKTDKDLRCKVCGLRLHQLTP